MGSQYSTIIFLDAISRLGYDQGNEITVDNVTHEKFKGLTHDCKAVVRTGECTPFANVILYAGVTFGGDQEGSD